MPYDETLKQAIEVTSQNNWLQTSTLVTRLIRFEGALKADDIASINAILAYEAGLSGSLSPFFNIAKKYHFRSYSDALLVIYGESLFKEVEQDRTLFDAIYEDDATLTACLTQQISARVKYTQSLRAQVNVLKEHTTRLLPHNPYIWFNNKKIEFLIRMISILDNLKAYDMKSWGALARRFEWLLEDVTQIFEITQYHHMPQYQREALYREIDLALTFFQKHPCYQSHVEHLYARLNQIIIANSRLRPLGEANDIQDALSKICTQSWGSSQDWIMKAFEVICDSSLKGLCFGFSVLTILALVQNRFEHFKMQVEIIKDESPWILKAMAGLDFEDFFRKLEHAQIHQDYLKEFDLFQCPDVIDLKRFKYRYDFIHLLTYFTGLKRVIDDKKPQTPYIVLSFLTQTHVMNIAYDVQKKIWILIDINGDSAIEYIRNEWVLAERVIYNLRFEHHLLTHREIETVVFSLKSQSDIVKNIFDTWLALPETQAVHSLPYQQAWEQFPFHETSQCDSNQSLIIGILTQDLELTAKSLHPANLNGVVHEGVTPLLLAINLKSEEIVAHLIKVKANIYYAPQGKSSPIEAALKSSPSIFGLLLKAGWKGDVEFLLRLIISANRLEHFKVFLKQASQDLMANLLKCADIQSYLAGWIQSTTELQEVIALISWKHQASFFNQAVFDKILPSCIHSVQECIAILTDDQLELSTGCVIIRKLFECGSAAWLYGFDSYMEVLRGLPPEKAAFFQSDPNIKSIESQWCRVQPSLPSTSSVISSNIATGQPGMFAQKQRTPAAPLKSKYLSVAL